MVAQENISLPNAHIFQLLLGFAGQFKQVDARSNLGGQYGMFGNLSIWLYIKVLLMMYLFIKATISTFSSFENGTVKHHSQVCMPNNALMKHHKLSQTILLKTFLFIHHFGKVFQVWGGRNLSGNFVFPLKVSLTLFHLELLSDYENSPVCLSTSWAMLSVLVSIAVRTLTPGLFFFPMFKLATLMLLYYALVSNCLEFYIKQKRNFFGNMHSKIYRE